MDTYRDQVGQWATLHVRAASREEATQRARREARREGLRVTDVASATRQTEGHGWRVEVRVALRLGNECE